MPNELFRLNQSFGDLLRYLRRRERLTQLELSIMVGYSEAQIRRLEKNQRRPDITALKALFFPALHLDKEPELAGYFLELAQSARQEDAPAPGVSPYKGLLFFDESDYEMFFGREALTAKLAGHVMDLARDASSQFLAVVGASGSGKSSIVRAGLAATLRRAGWDICVFTPTANPLMMLETSLNATRTKSAERVLLLVDQFEEVFTLCRAETERITFIEKLLSLAQGGSKKSTVVITLRADFYAHCAVYPLLRQAVAAHQEYIGQMSREELRRAIEEPAKRSGWEFEPGLVDVLLQDVGAHGSQEPEPGALPLLSHALLATWEHRRGRLFTIDGYHVAGGVRGAIAETAESIFTDKLNQSQQAIARDVFLRLTELGEGTEDTRRRAALNELLHQSEEATQLRGVLNMLAEARLLTLSEDTAEVAHEALIREWQRLRQWLNEDREGLKLHRHLTETVREWELRGREVSELYRGARLAQAREWALTNEARLNERERLFLKTSVEAEQHEALEREAQRQRELETVQKLAQTEKARAEEHIQSANRLRTRNRAITTVGVIAIALAVLAGMFGIQSTRNAEVAQRNLTTAQTAQAIAENNYANAESRRLAYAAEAILSQNVDPVTATLLSIRSLRSGYSTEADASLIRSFSSLYSRKLFKAHTDIVSTVAFSPDGKYALTGSWDGTARLWNIRTGQEIRRYVGYADIYTVTFSPDGRFVLTESDIGAQLWDTETAQLLHGFSNQGGAFNLVAFSPDGKYILTVTAISVRLWDAFTGQAIRDFIVNTTAASFSPDGKYILTDGGSTSGGIWEIATGKEFHPSPEVNSSVIGNVFSPDSKKVLAGYTDGIAISPDGKFVLTRSQDSEIALLWDTQTRKEVRHYLGHTAYINIAAFSPDSQYVLTGSYDRTARLWATPMAPPLFSFIGHKDGITDVAYSPNGKYVLTGSMDHTARLWDAESRQELRSFVGHTKVVTSVDFSADGKYVLTGSDDQTARLWDASTGKGLRVFADHTEAVTSVAFSPDGRYVLTGSDDQRARLWDAATGKKIRTFEKGPGRSKSNGSTLVFSPDGKKVLIRGLYGNVHLFDIATGQELGRFTHKELVNSVAFSPDGKYVLTGSYDKTARLWNAATGKELGIFTDQASAVLSVAFAPDGSYVLTGHSDNTARLWDTVGGQAVRTFTGHADMVTSVTFSPDGKYVITGSEDGTGRLWHTDYLDTIYFACSLLGRDLTESERRQYNILDDTPACPKP